MFVLGFTRYACDREGVEDVANDKQVRDMTKVS